MSIETSIDKLADALFAVAAAINGKEQAPAGKSSGNPAATQTAAPSPKETRKAAKADPATESPSEGKSDAKSPPADTQSTAAAGEGDAPSGKDVNYKDDIAPLFLKLISAKGRDAGRAFIDGYKPNAAKLSEAITEAQYPEVLAKLQEALS